jgi:LysR family hca operon transcriptional activator
MGISLIMPTRGVGLLPAYAQNFLPASVTNRPLKGDVPTVDLVLGNVYPRSVCGVIRTDL